MATAQSPAARGPLDSRLANALRSINDRLRKLENRKTIIVGGWRIYEADDGSLVAYNPTTDVTQTLAG